jgi:putative peptidoglycan lipid II flippase
LLGLVRSVAIADAFGTDPELDAFWVAFRLPDLVFQLLAGATLSAAFIPVFSRVVLRHGEEDAWRLASSVLNLVAIATFVLAAVAFILAPLIVPLFAPGLGEATGRQDELRALAVDLTRLMLISPLFFGISGMFMGILNARQHFAAPAFAPVIYNLGIIAGAWWLSESLGVHGLAWGAVVGAAGHLLIQVPALYRAGMRWSPSLDFFSSSVQDVMRLMGPRVIGLAAAQINIIALIFFASFISDGAISVINYAFLIVMLPVGVIGMAISTAAFPTLARLAAAGEDSRLRATLTRGLRMILFLAVPAAAGLIVLAEPGARVLLERGAFDENSTDLVATTLMIYAISVIGQSGVEILSRGFYALGNTRTPVTVAIGAMVLNIILAAVFVGPFELRGLAAAASIAASLEFIALAILIGNRIDGFDILPLRRTIGSTAIGTIVLVQVTVIALLLIGAAGLDGGTTLGAFVRVVVAGGLGGLAFLGVTFALHRDDYALSVRR